VHALDLDGVLDMMKKALFDKHVNSTMNFDFFHACLDRINNIILERNAKVSKHDMLDILRVLSYYRPK
jgi:hypothetical protein